MDGEQEAKMDGKSDGGQMATYKQKTWRKNQECQRPEGRLNKNGGMGKTERRLLMIQREEETEEETSEL